MNFGFGDIVKIIKNDNERFCYGTIGIITNSRGETYEIETEDDIGYASMHDIELIRKYDPESTADYEKGLEDGWNLAVDIYDKYTSKMLNEIFDCCDPDRIVRTNTAKEVIEKVQRWKDEQVKNGDIVSWDDCKILVTYVDDTKIQGLCLEDMAIISTAKKNVKKVLNVNYKDQLEDLFDQIYNAVAWE